MKNNNVVILPNGKIKVEFPPDVMKAISDTALFLNISEEDVINQILTKLSTKNEKIVNKKRKRGRPRKC